jgi:flagellar assembly protein FliH
MSLSKYYESSNFFQPEELVKRADKTQASSGWQSLATKAGLPFQTQQLPAASASPKLAAPAVMVAPATAGALDTPDTENGSTGQATAGKTPPDVAPLQQNIDLSNYLELAIVEKKIEEAYQKGLQAGIEKGEQDFDAATRTLFNTCQQLDTIRETIIGNSSEELQNFALAIAERIVRISVREQDNTIIATIEEALQRAVKSDEFTVSIHPEDYQAVAENSAELIAGLTGLNKIVIKKDSRVERGGAKIESDNCTIDATILSQFDMIRQDIKKNL